MQILETAARPGRQRLRVRRQAMINTTMMPGVLELRCHARLGMSFVEQEDGMTSR